MRIDKPYSRKNSPRAKNNWMLCKLKELNIKPKEFCGILGMTQPHFYRLVFTPLKFSNDDVIKMASRLGIPVRDVLAWVYSVESKNIGRLDNYWFE